MVLGFRSVVVTFLVLIYFCLAVQFWYSDKVYFFLNTLHWPTGSDDLRHFGVTFSELLILFEQWAGHRLLREQVIRPHVRANCPILIPSVPVSDGIEIRHGCQFLRSLVRALAKLPGGLGRFLPCRLGSHMSRLRHLGWNQCSHGLSSRPLESCHHQCLNAVCEVLGCPEGSALELLDGTFEAPTLYHYFCHAFAPFLRRHVQVVITQGKDCAPLPPNQWGEGGEVGGPRNLFPRLAVG